MSIQHFILWNELIISAYGNVGTTFLFWRYGINIATTFFIGCRTLQTYYNVVTTLCGCCISMRVVKRTLSPVTLKRTLLLRTQKWMLLPRILETALSAKTQQKTLSPKTLERILSLRIPRESSITKNVRGDSLDEDP